MKKNLVVVVALVLVMTHIIPPYHTVLANEEERNCENMNFSVQTIKENDESIKGNGFASDQLKVDFIAKNQSKTVSINSGGQFELKIEEADLQASDVIRISNDYYSIEMRPTNEEADSQMIKAQQHLECPVVEEVAEQEDVEDKNEKTNEYLEPGEVNNTEKDPEPEEKDNSEKTEKDTGKEEQEDTTEELELSDRENPSEHDEIAKEPVIKESSQNSEVETESEDYKKSYKNEDKESKPGDKNEIDEYAVREVIPYKSDARYVRSDRNVSLTDVQNIADVSLFSNINIESEIFENEQPLDNMPYNLSLSLNGSGIADVELVDTNRVVVFVIPELANQITATEAADVSVNLTLVSLEDLPVLGGLVGNVTSLLTDVVNDVLSLVDRLTSSLISDELITIEGVDDLQGSLNGLNNLDRALTDVLSYNGSVPVIVNDDGTIKVDMTDALGNNLETAVNDTVIGTLEDLVDNLNGLRVAILPEAEGIPLLGSVVRLLNGVINTTLVTVTGLAGTVTNLLNDLDVPGLTSELARAQLLGSTDVQLNVEINNPIELNQSADNVVPVYGAALNTAVIDASLIDTGTSESEIVFPQQRDETAPIINTADVNKISGGGYTVSGIAEEPGDRIDVTNSTGEIVGSGVILEDFTFSINITGSVSPDEVLNVQAFDEAGNESEIYEVTIPILQLQRVPVAIEFSEVEIKNGETIFYRQSTDNVIEIRDTRKEGQWQLHAQASPLAAGNNILEKALIYRTGSEDIVLNDTASIVVESEDQNISSDNSIDRITWNNIDGNQDGILLKLNPVEAIADTEYSSQITWTLTDGP